MAAGFKDELREVVNSCAIDLFGLGYTHSVNQFAPRSREITQRSSCVRASQHASHATLWEMLEGCGSDPEHERSLWRREESNLRFLRPVALRGSSRFARGAHGQNCHRRIRRKRGQ